MFRKSKVKNIGLVGLVNSGKTSLLLSLALELADRTKKEYSTGAVTMNGSHLINHFTALLDTEKDIIPSDPNLKESIEFDNFGQKYLIKDIGGEAFSNMSHDTFYQVSDLFNNLDVLMFIIEGQYVENQQSYLTDDITLMQTLAELQSNGSFDISKKLLIFLVNKSDLCYNRYNPKRHQKIERIASELFQIPISTFSSRGINTETIGISCHKSLENNEYDPYSRINIDSVLRLLFRSL